MINFTKKDEIFFRNNGYLIKQTEDLKNLNYLRKKVIELIVKKKPSLKSKLKIEKEEIFLNNFHKYIKKSELNSIRLFVIDIINRNKSFAENYYSAGKKSLDFLVGNELAMQSKINLSIQTPNDHDSMLPMHSDIYAGESPFEANLWIPLVNVKADSRSMFITSPKNNKKINRLVENTKSLTLLDIYKKNKKKFKFLKINFGEVLVFSPIMLHGNIVNKTKFTRFSLNCRFKSLLSPFDVFNKTHRNIPHFFKPLNIKPFTQIGFNFIKKINEKK